MLERREKEEMKALDRFAGITLEYLLRETQLGSLLSSESMLFDSAKEKYARLAYDMAEAMLEAREDREIRDAY